MRFTGTKETTSAKAEALFVGIAYDLFAYLRDLLAEHGIMATYAIGITEGIRLFARQPYHLLFLELNEEHGESSAQLVTALRRARAAPILLLTGTENEESIMKMVRCGVDICVPNAFPPFLIEAYILSMIRRYTDYNRQDSIGDMPMQRGDISIDPLGRTVEVRGRAVALRPREFALLYYFMRHPNIVLSAGQICAGAWGLEEGYGGDVSGPVSILRRAIEPNPQEPVYIETVHQFGYRFTAHAVGTCGEWRGSVGVL